MKPPIFITCYNRLWTLERTLASLKQCDGYANREIHFFCDSVKYGRDLGVYRVRKWLEDHQEANWRLFYWYDENLGIRQMTLRAIDVMRGAYDSFIFLQDDMEFSKDFLLFMDWALEEYKNDESIMIVSGYSQILNDNCYKSLFASEAMGIWTKKWDRMIGKEDYQSIVKNKQTMKDWEEKTAEFVSELLENMVKGKNDSFGAVLSYSLYKNGKYCLHPDRNKLRHIVTDSVNCKKRDSKWLNQDLYEGWDYKLDYGDYAHRQLQVIYKRKLLKRFTRMISKLIGR